jgi:hypothetical protein
MLPRVAHLLHFGVAKSHRTFDCVHLRQAFFLALLLLEVDD